MSMLTKNCRARDLKASENTYDADSRIISGYAATWDRDNCGDRIEKGAFSRTLEQRGPKNGKSRIKVLWQHDKPIGIPIEMYEDDRGLFVKAKISKTTLGDEALELMRDGVVDTMSIGFDIIKDYWDDSTNLRIIQEVRLYEFSPVSFAANENTEIVSVKKLKTILEGISGNMGYSARIDMLEKKLDEFIAKMTTKDWVVGGAASIPLAGLDVYWDGRLAESAMRTWAGGEDLDYTKYQKGFVVYDNEDSEKLGSYKLPFCSVIGDELKAVPAGIFAAAAALQGARGGVDLPEGTISSAKTFLGKYYKEMDKLAPWEKSSEESELKTLFAELKDSLVEALSLNLRSIEDRLTSLDQKFDAGFAVKFDSAIEKAVEDEVEPETELSAEVEEEKELDVVTPDVSKIEEAIALLQTLLNADESQCDSCKGDGIEDSSDLSNDSAEIHSLDAILDEVVNDFRERL